MADFVTLREEIRVPPMEENGASAQISLAAKFPVGRCKVGLKERWS
jgi:hypothetical protein